MVKEYRKAQVKPEERAAERLLDKHKLSPPFDIKALVSIYADVSFMAFPVDADGITLNPKSTRPEIIINESKSESRQLFTLAHELGHVRLPWHIGNFVSHTDSLSIGDQSYIEREAEANRFAAEILMPSKWALSIFDTKKSIGCLLNIILNATGSSCDAALIKIFNILPAGHIGIEINDLGFVVATFSSPKTPSQTPSIGACLLGKDPYSLFSKKESVVVKGRKFIFYSFTDTKAPPSIESSSEWRTVFNQILDDTGLHHKLQNINGILASGFDRNSEKSDAEIFTIVLYKFSGNSELDALINHPSFESFVYMRISELRLKRTGKKG